MNRHGHTPLSFLGIAFILLAGCGSGADEDSTTTQAFVGARLIDGSGSAPTENSVILVADGEIVAAGPAESVEIPFGATQIDVTGRTIIPGLINTHGHAGDVRGMEAGQYSRENVLDQLGLYARYGVTTVVSLGDDREEGVQIRDEQTEPDLSRARLFVAGPVLTPTTPEEAVEAVGDVSAMNVDWAKIRIDSSLGRSAKMSPETYQAVVDEAHRLGIPVAVHIVELEDAKGALRAGADFIAHSVRDQPVDDELISLLLDRGVCYTPTLTRELSTFVYGSRPDFFDDPFFQQEADPAVIAALEDPARQQSVRENAANQYWQAQLPLAMQNVKALSDAGVMIGMGTDTGPVARFQGYFEHLEMEMMAEAGMTPMEILTASTGDAARCVGLDQQIGTIESGKRADFIVLRSNPLEDIRNTRTIESVWINGNQVPGVS